MLNEKRDFIIGDISHFFNKKSFLNLSDILEVFRMKRLENIVFVLLMVLLFPMLLNAQKEQGFKPKVKWYFRGQFWLRYSDLNEGSLINGEPTSNYTDVSIRRLRIPISTQVTPKVYAYALFGGNNYNFKSKDAKI